MRAVKARSIVAFFLLGLILPAAVGLTMLACSSAKSAPSAISTVVPLTPGSEQTLAPTVPSDGWKDYANPDFAVSLRYPGDWQQAGDTRFEGPDGFFGIDAISSGYSLEDTCSVTANHKLKPYGSNPTIEYLTIQGARGCLILPSSDAPPSEKSLSTLILPYPALVRVHCSEVPGYNHLSLFADKDHIRQIADTVTFLLPVPTPSDCPPTAPSTP